LNVNAWTDEELPRRVYAHSATAAESTVGGGRSGTRSHEEALKSGESHGIIADGQIQNPISNALLGNGTIIQ
jgi:hypothetical protein